MPGDRGEGVKDTFHLLTSVQAGDCTFVQCSTGKGVSLRGGVGRGARLDFLNMSLETAGPPADHLSIPLPPILVQEPLPGNLTSINLHGSFGEAPGKEE